MGYLGNADTAYTGGSGQMAVMAELLQRRCNVAIPHIDVGTDVFAHRDDREDVARVQVKTARGKRYSNGNGYSARFAVPIAQLNRTDEPPLFYAFAVRLEGWGSFILLSRATLKQLWNDGCGRENEKSGNLELYVQFRMTSNENDDQQLTAFCGKFNFTAYINAWDALPPLKSPKEISA